VRGAGTWCERGGMDTLTVSEVFGPTVQGEGPSQGRRAAFVRLGRCNLDCSWCDTPFTWDWSGKNGTVYDPAVELSRQSVESVAERVRAMNVPLLVVTGGEPMIQQRKIVSLASLLPGVDVEVETNGTLLPDNSTSRCVRYNTSVKLANSGIDEDRRIVPDAIGALRDSGKAQWKFVVQGGACMDEVDRLVDRFGLDPGDVWIMPEGRDNDTLKGHMSAVADRAVTSGYNLTGRLHVSLWGDVRGR